MVIMMYDRTIIEIYTRCWEDFPDKMVGLELSSNGWECWVASLSKEGRIEGGRKDDKERKKKERQKHKKGREERKEEGIKKEKKKESIIKVMLGIMTCSVSCQYADIHHVLVPFSIPEVKPWKIKTDLFQCSSFFSCKPFLIIWLLLFLADEKPNNSLQTFPWGNGRNHVSYSKLITSKIYFPPLLFLWLMRTICACLSCIGSSSSCRSYYGLSSKLWPNALGRGFCLIWPFSFEWPAIEYFRFLSLAFWNLPKFSLSSMPLSSYWMVFKNKRFWRCSLLISC